MNARQWKKLVDGLWDKHATVDRHGYKDWMCDDAFAGACGALRSRLVEYLAPKRIGLVVTSAASAKLKRAQETAAIKRFLTTGHTTHSRDATTLPAIVNHCEEHGLRYALHAMPGVGYELKLIKTCAPVDGTSKRSKIIAAAKPPLKRNQGETKHGKI